MGSMGVGVANGWRDMRCVAEMSDTLIDSQIRRKGSE